MTSHRGIVPLSGCISLISTDRAIDSHPLKIDDTKPLNILSDARPLVALDVHLTPIGRLWYAQSHVRFLPRARMCSLQCFYLLDYI